MIQFRVGIVTHFYEKTGTIVVHLERDLAVGEKISFMRDQEKLFETVVDGIWYETQSLNMAGKDQIVSLKVKNQVTPGTLIYKLSQ